MILALTGATGFVGSAVLERALAEGHIIRALTRRPQPEQDRVEWISGDLADRDALARLTDGAASTIHVAGVINAHDQAGFDVGNVTGTQSLINAVLQSGGQGRFVFVSSLSAREPALSIYGQSKACAETIVAQSGLDWVSVRPPAVYGPRDHEMFELFRMANRGVVPVPSHGRASLIHVYDLARLLITLAEQSQAEAGKILEPDDGAPEGWDHALLAGMIGVAVGKKPFVLRLSPWMMQSAAVVDTFLRRDKAKLTSDRARYFSHPDWVVRADMRPDPALWQPEIRTPDGLSKTASWYKAQGWL